jgi:hypothetical protein
MPDTPIDHAGVLSFGHSGLAMRLRSVVRPALAAGQGHSELHATRDGMMTSARSGLRKILDLWSMRESCLVAMPGGCVSATLPVAYR